MFPHLAHHSLTNRIFIGPDQRLNLVRAEVTRHDDHRVLKVHRTSLTVGHTTVIKHLQKDVENIRVSLFHLIEQNDAIRFTANGLCQVAAFLIAHISRRCTDQTSHRVLFHELTHINTDHGIFRIKEEFSQGFGQFSLTDTRRS